MSKVTLDLTSKQIMNLAEKLQDFTTQFRIRKILERIDARKGLRPSTRDILKEIHTHRNQKHAQSRH